MTTPTTPATGLVIHGQRVLVPGVDRVENWHDNPEHALNIPQDGRPRPTDWIRAVVVHSTKGEWPQVVRPGTGPAGNAAEANVRYWARSAANVGTQLIIDFDGQVICACDLAETEAYHAESVNPVTIGIELVQGSSPAGAYFYQRQLEVLVAVVDVITARLGIQRQIQAPYHGSAHAVARLHKGGADAVGVYMHRDQTTNRGRGDAGDCVLEAFLHAGYEPVDFDAGTDLATWKARQAAMNALGAKLTVDGIPGPATAQAVAKYYGKKAGMWIERA